YEVIHDLSAVYCQFSRRWYFAHGSRASLTHARSRMQSQSTSTGGLIMDRMLACCLLWLACLSGSAYGQWSPPLVRFDNFNQKFLDPNKWATSSPCFTWTVLDCVREIQNGQLRLGVRGFGATDSNQGSQYAESELHFLRPSTIKSIATDLVLRRL